MESERGWGVQDAVNTHYIAARFVTSAMIRLGHDFRDTVLLPSSKLLHFLEFSS
jgi:hypothetical protein